MNYISVNILGREHHIKQGDLCRLWLGKTVNDKKAYKSGILQTIGSTKSTVQLHNGQTISVENNRIL